MRNLPAKFIYAILIITLFACSNKGTKSENNTAVFEEGKEIIEDDINNNIPMPINEKIIAHYAIDNLRIRESDDILSPIVTTLPKYTALRIIETGKIETIDGITAPWVKIVSQTGYTGWCFSGYVRELEKTELIKIENCEITRNYSVPNIRNRIFGINDDESPYELILENDFHYIWDGIQITLKNDISTENIIVILKNQKYEFKKTVKLVEITDHNGETLGYYANVKTENKPWLNADDNKWWLIVMADTRELINKEFEFNGFSYIFFEELEDNPFVINNLHYATFNKEYTYRYKRDRAEILVLYYSDDYEVYAPLLYLLPLKNDNNDYVDIKISWNNEILAGIYCIGKYKLNDLPREEETYAIFNFIGLK